MEKATRSLVEMKETVGQVLRKRKFGIATVRFLCPVVLAMGREYKREKIIQLIYDYYTRVSGKSIEKEKVALTVKSFVKDRDNFERFKYYNGDRGYYRYIGPSNPDHVIKYHLEEDGDSEPIDNLNPEYEYGEGEAEVYGWCLPLYQKTADPNGCYPIAIGYAGPEGFVGKNYNIVKNLPETPVYLLRFRCSDENTAKDIAEYLRLALKMKNKQITNTDGPEWFQTNWKEIEEIINTVRITSVINHKKQN